MQAFDAYQTNLYNNPRKLKNIHFTTILKILAHYVADIVQVNCTISATFGAYQS